MKPLSPITPQTAVQYFQQGNQAVEAGQLEKALTLYHKAIEINPNFAFYHQTLGDTLAKIGKWKEATIAYQKAIKLKPNSAWSYHSLGNVQQQQGQLDEAIASYSQAIKINPNFSEFYIGLGTALVEKGLLYEAISHFQKAISLEPDSSIAHQNLGVALEKQGQIEEGIICYRKAIEIDPGFWEGYQKLGTALTKLGDLHQAAEIYLKACQIIPNFATVYHYCGETLAKLHRWDEAIVAYRRAIDLLGSHRDTTPTAAIYHQFGYALTQKQQWDEAVSAYRQATELQPNSPEVYHHLGYALAQQQKWDEATIAYRKVTELQPNSPEVHHYLGYALSQQQKWEEAVVAYRKASELQPNSPDIHHQLGEALIQLKQNDWAVVVLRQAVELNPNLAEAYGDLGKALSNIKQWDEAIASFEKAIKLNPNLAEVYGYLGEVYAAQKQWDEAIVNYRRALEFNPKLPEVHHSLALALVQQQKFDDAIVSYRQAIELGINTAEVHHQLGHTLSRLKRWDEAVVCYGRAAEINPNSAAVYHVLGESLVQLEKWDEAIAAYRKASQLNPKSADVKYHIGEVMSILGRWDEAVVAYEKAVELRPNSAKFHFQLGEAKTKKNPLSEAIICYRRALEIDPHFSKAKTKLEEVSSVQNIIETGEFGSLSLLGETEFEGCLDYATIDYVSGWARHKKDPDKVVFLDIFVGNNLIGTLVANKYRQDLAEAFDTHGYHAFAQKIPPSLHSNGLVEVSVKITETGQQLKNSPKSLVVGPKGKKHEVNLSFGQGEINKLIYLKKSGVSPQESGVKKEGVRSQSSGVRSEERRSQNSKFKNGEGVGSEEFKSQNSKFKSEEEVGSEELEEVRSKEVKNGEGVGSEEFKSQNSKFKSEKGVGSEEFKSQNSKFKSEEEVGSEELEEVISKEVKNGEGVGSEEFKSQKSKVNLEFKSQKSKVKSEEVNSEFKSQKSKFKSEEGVGSQELEEVRSKEEFKSQKSKVKSEGVGSEELEEVRSKEVKNGEGVRSQESELRIEEEVISQILPAKVRGEKPGVAVIILSLNGAKLLSELFASFELYNSYENLELVVVDHGSTDNSIDVCMEWSEKLPITIIARGENYSFSNSNNVGVDETRAPLLLFMNNDITLCQDIIPQMVELIQQDENLGMVGVKLLDIVSDKSLAFPPTQHLGVQIYFHSQNEPFYPFEVRYAPQLLKVQSAPWKVPVVTGALMMCRREDFQKVGGFNEDYFYGYEDVDLCLTIRQKLGKEIISANHLTAFHNRGFSRFNKGKEFIQKILKNRPIIEQRFAYYLRRKHLQDYFEKGIYWTGHPLTIGFAVTEANMAASAGDYFTAVELGEQLVKQFGWDVYYLSEGEEWYDMTRLDVIVVMRHDYDLERIENAKPSLVKVAWARNWFEIWASQKAAGDYDCFWCSSQKSADYIQQKLSKSTTVVRIATNDERFKEGVRSQESGVRSEEEVRSQKSKVKSEEEVRSEREVKSQKSKVKSEVEKNSEVGVSEDSGKIPSELGNKIPEVGKSELEKNSEVGVSEDSGKIPSELGNKIPEVGKSELEKNSEVGVLEESEKIPSELGNKIPEADKSQVENNSKEGVRSQESGVRSGEKIKGQKSKVKSEEEVNLEVKSQKSKVKSELDNKTPEADKSELENNSEVEISEQQEKVNSELENKYQSDYCFTGSFWKYPRDIMSFLEPDNLPFQFALYGYNWEKFEKFKKYNRGLLPYTDMPKVYASTKIVIDDANSVTKQWGSTNSRVFDAIISGALVVTNGELGNQESFDGVLPTYNSRESLENLLREYLTNEELRLTKVAELQKIVEEKHTYKHRAQTVFTALREKMSNSFRISIKIGVPDWKQVQEWGDYHYALAMKRQFEILGHSVRIDILPEWETPKSFGDDVAIVIRGLSRYQPKSYHINLIWNISHPDKVELAEYEEYDHIFVASYSYAEELQKQIKVPVQTLLQCTDQNLFYPDKEGYEEVGEILFVGNSRKVYRQIVKDAVEAGLKIDVYGTNWENLLPSGYLKGEYIPNEILRRYYSKCGVLLNDHWDTMRKKGFISNRLFDAAACGATIISDKISGLEKVFGDKISTYNSQEDLPKVVENCLQQKSQNIEEKLELAKYIRENHTFEKRVREILGTIEKLNQEKMLGKFIK
ncbi:MAG: tetratricopeptide repeat protein [Okeania sp. SIO2C9]|uniref:tetratricopeptide repeat protein n=1 Tax=Okeania sp. SIO2C9 TaxID=2607791 RepID=UPI0013C1E7BB|nr:tetratricopeptide repeat protein [Okeania sp. SIO2C9]NEQ74834.1 tetratricopeptide repeat protein [Okeania sp. SIO2C9]